MRRLLFAELSPAAREALRRGAGQLNLGGQTLRQWLSTQVLLTVGSSAQLSLLGEPIPVEEDVPLLLEGLSRVSNQRPDDLVEKWALDASAPEGRAEHQSHETSLLPEDARERSAELVDLAETLLEESISDARRRLGSYAEGDEALKAAAEVFAALRRVLGLVVAEVEEPK